MGLPPVNRQFSRKVADAEAKHSYQKPLPYIVTTLVMRAHASVPSLHGWVRRFQELCRPQADKE